MCKDAASIVAVITISWGLTWGLDREQREKKGILTKAGEAEEDQG